jgi:hypothetical protein
MSAFFCILSAVFFFIGLVTLFSPRRDSSSSSPVDRGSGLLARAAAASAGTDIFHTPPVGVKPVTGTAQKLDWIRVGQQIRVHHAVKGDLSARVIGRILYAELWQQARGPQNPWIPTGSQFLGFWLDDRMFLLNWQNRFYLLDEAVDLSDVDIQQHFAPYARRFAQSDQTAEVIFAYPPASWRMVDIGKFRVLEAQGEGLRFNPGAVGRFIHAGGSEARALVVEDYEGGGTGRDTAWIGYSLNEDEIKPA